MADEVEIIVHVKNDTQRGLAGVARSVGSAIRRINTSADRDGRGIGKRLFSGVVDSVKGAASGLQDAFQSTITGSLKGSLSTPIVGPIITAALLSAVVAAASVVAAAAASAIALGFGAGFVGIGAIILSQNEKIKKQITDDFKEVKDTLASAFKPLTPIFKTFGDTIKSVAKFFEPIIQRASELARGPLQRFIKNLGEAFKELGPAVEPLIQAFSDILDNLGPQLPGLFKSIGNSLKEIGKTVSENAPLFTSLFTVIIELIPPVIDAIGFLARVFANSFTFMLTVLDKVSGALAGFLDALSNVPGFEWARTAAEKLNGLGDTFRSVKKSIEDNEIEARVGANIQELNTKLARARRELKDPNLTKTRRAQLRAEIDQLIRAKRRAQAEINSLHGKTVYLNVIRTITGGGNPVGVIGGRSPLGSRLATGGNVRAAQNGGGQGGTTLVGEEGPEIVRLPFGSSVVPAGQSRRMMGNAQQGPTEIVLRFVGSDKLTKALVQSVQAGSRQQGGLQVKVVGSR